MKNIDYRKAPLSMTGRELVTATEVKAHRGMTAVEATAIREAAFAEATRRVENGSKFRAAWEAAGRLDEFLARKVSFSEPVKAVKEEHVLAEIEVEATEEVKAVAEATEVMTYTQEQLDAWAITRTAIWERTSGGVNYRKECAAEGIPVGKELRAIKAEVKAAKAALATQG